MVACEDDDLCTFNDTCSGGLCTGDPKNCDDNQLCTTDTCDPKTGMCLHTFNEMPCTCIRVSRPLVTQTGNKYIGGMSFQYNSTNGKVCFTADLLRGWKFRNVRIFVTGKELDIIEPEKFEFNKDDIDKSTFSDCVSPFTPVQCDSSLLHIYFYSDAYHGSQTTEPAWGFGISVPKQEGEYLCNSI